MSDEPTGPMAGKPQPPREAVLSDQRLRIVESPLLAGLLARVRDRGTPPAEFSAYVATIGQALILSACHDVRMEAVAVPGFDGNPIRVMRPAERIAAVTILRAGLVFADSFRRLVPDGPVYQVGAHRDERTLVATVYTENLPAQPGWSDRVLILDPMLATGGSILAAVALVRRTHSGRLSVISLVSAPLGVQDVLSADPTCEIFTAALDERLDDNGYIRPGLGDAGDRSFGTFG